MANIGYQESEVFARPENNLSFFAVTEGFLAKYLGGRYEPIDQAFKNSSIQVLEDAGDVRLHGLLGDVQAHGDELVRQALAEEGEHLALALGELALR